MFNVGDRVKHVGKEYDFDDLGVEVVMGTIVDINHIPHNVSVLYSVKFDATTEVLHCFQDEIERIT